MASVQTIEEVTSIWLHRAVSIVRIPKSKFGNDVGLTGLEPVTLRLSSACSNQLSYRPVLRLRREIFECRMSISDLFFAARFARIYLNRQSQIANRK